LAVCIAGRGRSHQNQLELVAVMKTNLLVAGILLLIFGASSISQDRTKPVSPARLETMRNLGLDTAKSGFPVALPEEWGRLIAVEETDAMGYSLFLQNDRGEIYIVRLIQRGRYLYLDAYDQGGVALVIRRSP
jgi:hypothetical protein